MIELRAARCLLGNCEVFDRVENCEEFVTRIVRCLIKLKTVRGFHENC